MSFAPSVLSKPASGLAPSPLGAAAVKPAASLQFGGSGFGGEFGSAGSGGAAAAAAAVPPSGHSNLVASQRVPNGDQALEMPAQLKGKNFEEIINGWGATFEDELLVALESARACVQREEGE